MESFTAKALDEELEQIEQSGGLRVWKVAVALVNPWKLDWKH